jgi:hypothetical protein
MGAHRPATCVVVFKLNRAQRGDNDDIVFATSLLFLFGF